MIDTVKIGIAGLGTVGSGTFKVLTQNSEEIARRVGCPIEIVHIGARRDHPDCDTDHLKVSRDIFSLIEDSELGILVELIGGTTVAKEFVTAAIKAGKHVVTANKALMAEHGREILSLAQEYQVMVAFEAAVAGGIPILKAIREGLVANHINWLAGIINGTGNFILTEMLKNREFSEVLKEAQALGYAEADPTLDIEGLDAAHKLTILASLSFGIPLSYEHVYTEGISKLAPMDLAYADELGYRIKHLGIARRSEAGIELRVHPTLIPKQHLMASVDGVMNAVVVHGDAAGPTLYHGAGAGSLVTASAVVADIVDIARQLKNEAKGDAPPLSYVKPHENYTLLSMEQVTTACYLRIQVSERPGILADIARILSTHGISIEAILQKPVHSHTGLIPIVILTQPVIERELNQALKEIESLPETGAPIMRIRVEILADY